MSDCERFCFSHQSKGGDVLTEKSRTRSRWACRGKREQESPQITLPHPVHADRRRLFGMSVTVLTSCDASCSSNLPRAGPPTRACASAVSSKARPVSTDRQECETWRRPISRKGSRKRTPCMLQSDCLDPGAFMSESEVTCGLSPWLLDVLALLLPAATPTAAGAACDQLLLIVTQLASAVLLADDTVASVAFDPCFWDQVFLSICACISAGSSSAPLSARSNASTSSSTAFSFSESRRPYIPRGPRLLPGGDLAV